MLYIICVFSPCNLGVLGTTIRLYSSFLQILPWVGKGQGPGCNVLSMYLEILLPFSYRTSDVISKGLTCFVFEAGKVLFSS